MSEERKKPRVNFAEPDISIYGDFGKVLQQRYFEDGTENRWYSNCTVMGGARAATLIANFLLLSYGSLVFISILFLYVHPTWRNLIIALQSGISSHVMLGAMWLAALLSIIFGVIGAIAVYKKRNITIGIEVFALICAIVFQAGLLYSGISQWVNNLEVAITFAVQSFDPSHPHIETMQGIQKALQCCGRGAPTDYAISNEGFPPGYVPLSCCDDKQYSLDICTNSSSWNKRSILKLREVSSKLEGGDIALEYSYNTGCYSLLQTVVFPCFMGIYSAQIAINLFSVVISAVMLQLSSIYDDDDDDIDGHRELGDEEKEMLRRAVEALGSERVMSPTPQRSSEIGARFRSHRSS